MPKEVYVLIFEFRLKNGGWIKTQNKEHKIRTQNSEPRTTFPSTTVNIL